MLLPSAILIRLARLCIRQVIQDLWSQLGLQSTLSQINFRFGFLCMANEPCRLIFRTMDATRVQMLPPYEEAQKLEPEVAITLANMQSMASFMLHLDEKNRGLLHRLA